MLRVVLLTILSALSGAWLLPASALGADKAACVAAYEEGQRLRARGELMLSREAFRVCAEPDCPEATKGDCALWHEEVESGLPTVVLGVRGAAGAANVVVSVDGQPRPNGLSGKAFAVDPGERRFVFERSDGVTKEVAIVIREGEKNRLLEISFEKSDTTTSSAGISPGTWIFGGLGVAGLTTFAIVGGLALSEKSDAEDSCAPHCPDNTVDDIRAKLIVADVALGVGLVSLGTATALLISALVDNDDAAASVSLIPAAGADFGAGLQLTF